VIDHDSDSTCARCGSLVPVRPFITASNDVDFLGMPATPVGGTLVRLCRKCRTSDVAILVLGAMPMLDGSPIFARSAC